LSTTLTESQLADHKLSEEDFYVLKWIYERRSVDYMASKLDTKSRNVRRRINGLCGRTEGIPNKYHKENQFVQRLPRKYSGAIRFQLNWRGLEVISDDIPSRNDSNEEDDVSLPEGNKSDQGERVRPHWLLSKHQIRDSPGGWGEELKVDEKRQVYTERQFKEMPDGSSEEYITTYYDGYEVQIYRETVVVRVDFPESRFRPEILWRKYRSRVREILSFVEDKFGLELISRPEHIEACMRGQHWAEVDNLFADWLWSNRDEVGDDRDGLQFHVYDEEGDQMALVDCSHGEPEFEWVHNQEAKAHMSNMKDLIMWGGYYEITPSDFKSLAWLRQNKDIFENVLDRLQDLEGLESRLDEVRDDLDLTRSQVEGLTVSIRQVRSRLDDLEGEVEDLGLSVKTHGSQISGLSEQMQNNRDEFYQELNSQSERIDETRSMAQDVVERVDYTRQEVGEVEERLERTREELSERVESDYELMREEVDGVSQRLNGVVQQNLELQNNQEDIMQELQMQRKQNAKKMDKLIEEQQKTFVDRVRDNMKSVKGVVSSIATSLF
jgi:predicted  nucleic acid-binding Zn-ribbon protein